MAKDARGPGTGSGNLTQNRTKPTRRARDKPDAKAVAAQIGDSCP
jgi:hypothetical protein